MLNYKEAKPKPTTNYDRLRAKSAEEMAEKIGVARGELASVEAAQADMGLSRK